MSASLVDRGVDGVLERAIETEPGTVYVVNPGRHTIRHVIETLDPEADSVRIHVMAAESVLKSVMDDFLVASRAADLVEADILALRTHGAETENAVIVTADRVIALLNVDDHVTGLSTDETGFVERATSAYAERWEEATPFNLRTPPLSRVHETLATDIGPEAQADFADVLDSLDTARGNGHGLDEVTISLLVAARNEALLYDISKWGEDVGIASKATFSRTKTRLEDKGLIDTEKVPIEVGRPRLRLKLGDERLKAANADEFANVALSVLP